jgi:hypothetical protein
MHVATIRDVKGEIPYYTSSLHSPTAYYENPVQVGGDVVLVRKEGSPVYTINYWYTVPGYLSYALKGHQFSRMPLSELNLKAIVRVDEQRGIRFRVVR